MELQQHISTPTVYIGLDIHKNTWSVSIETDICHHKTSSFVPDAEKLYQYIDSNFKNHLVEITYEAGCCGFGAARHFAFLGWKTIIVNPADVPKSDKQNYQKTDILDSRNLCKQLMKDNLKPIYIPSEAHEQMRSLFRERMSVSKNLRRVKSQIKGMLLFHGVAIPEEFKRNCWSLGFKKWLSDYEFSTELGTKSLRAKLETLHHFHKQYLSIANDLRAYCRKHQKENYDLLKSIPGIGGFTASALIAEIWDFSRFDNESAFSSYLGMVPGIFNSGGSEKTTGITPRANNFLRSLLVENTWIAIGKDPEMQAFYRTHIGKNPKTILIKCGHKMARRILAIVKTKQPYEINKNLVLDTNFELPAEIEIHEDELENDND
jgi:transposase